MTKQKGKPFPVFRTDEEVEHFIDTADLSEYDFSGFKPLHLVLRERTEKVTLRMPNRLWNSIKTAAIDEGVPYSQLMRDLLKQGLEARAKSSARKRAS